jgi:hypothetical protein
MIKKEEFELNTGGTNEASINTKNITGELIGFEITSDNINLSVITENNILLLERLNFSVNNMFIPIRTYCFLPEKDAYRLRDNVSCFYLADEKINIKISGSENSKCKIKVIYNA